MKASPSRLQRQTPEPHSSRSGFICPPFGRQMRRHGSSPLVVFPISATRSDQAFVTHLEDIPWPSSGSPARQRRRQLPAQPPARCTVAAASTAARLRLRLRLRRVTAGRPHTAHRSPRVHLDTGQAQSPRSSDHRIGSCSSPITTTGSHHPLPAEASVPQPDSIARTPAPRLPRFGGIARARARAARELKRSDDLGPRFVLLDDPGRLSTWRWTSSRG